MKIFFFLIAELFSRFGPNPCIVYMSSQCTTIVYLLHFWWFFKYPLRCQVRDYIENTLKWNSSVKENDDRTFIIINQISHSWEGDRADRYPSKKHCQPWLRRGWQCFLGTQSALSPSQLCVIYILSHICYGYG